MSDTHGSDGDDGAESSDFSSPLRGFMAAGAGTRGRMEEAECSSHDVNVCVGGGYGDCCMTLSFRGGD